MKHLFTSFLLLAVAGCTFVCCDKDEKTDDLSNYMEVNGKKTTLAGVITTVDNDGETPFLEIGFLGTGLSSEGIQMMKGKGDALMIGTPNLPGTYTIGSDGVEYGMYYKNFNPANLKSGADPKEYCDDAGLLQSGTITWSVENGVYTIDVDATYKSGLNEDAEAVPFKVHYKGTVKLFDQD